ncbi:arsenosugar biosynthesis radical SAM (seleno)protein ArsS [Candidatus Viridilinea mediisalina]|uniref:Radical SAM protein n=1 Tax=Candidatus Viridilinea mediisalina TaxID=2024553 RepID=A0A2A6RGB8_9CHLR|nr:arsenosugar biosynthesis radical SAM (seleno)protein ArsS [Candidatus Viridilinea mediisalina]PDW02174.1 radical SAM protein [Candidatus Viridilinea mediisalina]
MSNIRLIPTLQRRNHPLATAAAQRRRLAEVPIPRFGIKLSEVGAAPLRAAERIEVLQINVGRRCNQTCLHCHVDAGPDRTEVMPTTVVDACLNLLATAAIPTLDITGGAPELHPDFDSIVRRARALGCHVIDRCNLTITGLPNYAYLPEFLAEHQVEVIASLPHYELDATDNQRGAGVFAESLAALKRFNAVGYGQPGGPALNLITNPVGACLPSPQAQLEAEWRRELLERYGISFTRLYTLTNMPISRYLDHLVATGELEAYMQLLVEAFNPSTVAGLMCRTTLSVGWDGQLYDCDFNQMLAMALPQSIFEVTPADLAERTIRVAAHCYACTAASGST